MGAILLEAGYPNEAETVYWEDLRRNRDSGWSLYGLLKALQAQNKTEDAAQIEVRFKKAWEAGRYCIDGLTVWTQIESGVILCI